MSASVSAPRARARRRGFTMPRWANIALAVGAFLFAAFVLPFLTEESSTFMNNLVLAAAYAVMALGLNIIVGFAGLLDLGYVAFYALGAFAMGYGGSLFLNVGGDEGVQILADGGAGLHVNFLIILVIAIVFTTLAGMLIGLPTLRLRGDYIAIVTLAFGEIIGRVAAQGDTITFNALGWDQTLTAGRQGITPIDKIDLPFLERFTSLNLRPWYWTALVLFLLVLFVNFRLRDSGARGSRCARTRSPPRPWACRSSRRSCSPTAPAPRSAGCPGRSWPRTTTRSTPTSSSSSSRSSSSPWSSSAGSGRCGAWSSARSCSRSSTTCSSRRRSTACPGSSASTST
jgi:hypothetical protein